MIMLTVLNKIVFIGLLLYENFKMNFILLFQVFKPDVVCKTFSFYL